MSKDNITIWGRKFSLNVCYKIYPGEDVLNIQKEAYEKFQQSGNAILDSCEKVKKYIVENNAAELGANEINNIFKYVVPKSIYVPRDKKHRIVAIMCNYKFDMEHGLAVVFENEQLKTIGPEDIVL